MAEAPKTGYARLAGPDIFGIALRGKPPLAALIRLEAAFAKVLHRFAMLLRGARRYALTK